MLYYIRFSDKIKRMMIEHTFKDPLHECGGFLYGDLTIEDNKTFCDVDAIYYENIIGTTSDFDFGFKYIIRALLKDGKEEYGKLIGTYHSHGQHLPYLSETDHNDLQKFFGANKVTVVYSPKYSKIVGEFLDENGISHKAKILTKY